MTPTIDPLEELDDALEELRREGGEVRGLTADTSRMDDVRRVFREADERLGGIDVLVNNAAVSSESFEGEELGEIEYVVRTTVAGYLACAREAVERMKRRGAGHVVNVGSMSADLREPDGAVYVATKGAVQAFSESLRKTVNPGGIRVTLVEPGKVATDMLEMSDAEKREKVDALEMLRAEDVAACVYFALVQPRRCDVCRSRSAPTCRSSERRAAAAARGASPAGVVSGPAVHQRAAARVRAVHSAAR